MSIWIFIIDGLYFSLNFDLVDTATWAKVLVLFSGYAFCLPVTIGCFMLLIWIKPKDGAVMIMSTVVITATLRLIATVIGFEPFWQESRLSSTTEGTTDIAIALLQTYLIFDALHLYRKVEKIELIDDTAGYIDDDDYSGNSAGDDAL